MGLLTVSLGSCKSEYQQYVDAELASGETRDSLILGMRMGQTKKDFFEICWQLNKQKLISQGPGNNRARIEIDRDSTLENSRAKELLFYGIFDGEDVMRGMDMTYSYTAWAPWNEERHAAALVEDLRAQYLRGYPGNEFIEVELPGGERSALVKIDGNRQILLYPKNNKDVVVKIEDLNHKLKEEWEKE